MEDKKMAGRLITKAWTGLALVLIALILLLPNRLSLISPAAFALLPLEPLLLGLVLLIPGLIGRVGQLIAALLLTLGVIIKVADIGAYQVFDRAFNPVLDGRWPADGFQLLQGSLGLLGAVIVVMLLMALLLAISVISYKALGLVQGLLRQSAKSASLGLIVGLMLWIALVGNGWQVATAPFYQLLAEHSQQAMTGMVDLQAFEQQLKQDPYAAVTNDKLFKALKGKDVLVVFVESYGRTVVDKADYAAKIKPLLAKGSADLAAQGIQARSAYLTSPTYGGISWLAHGTLMSGLWLNSQLRYDRLVMSQRPALNRLFQRAGWRTVAVQPAHTMPWPQGKYFGYDQIYAAQDLGYHGQPFNWITMPDQFTLSAVQSLERKAVARKPLMAEIALISSHAPWTPLPKMVDWQQLGDGQIFNQARVGDAPEVVWQNTERIREQYRKSIEYALSNIIAYSLRYADDNLVLVVLGDHQPSPFVTEESPSHEVLVHLISRDTKLMQAVTDWQWTEGLLPADNAPVLGMDKMREQFIAAFSK